MLHRRIVKAWHIFLIELLFLVVEKCWSANRIIVRLKFQLICKKKKRSNTFEPTIFRLSINKRSFDPKILRRLHTSMFEEERMTRKKRIFLEYNRIVFILYTWCFYYNCVFVSLHTCSTDCRWIKKKNGFCMVFMIMIIR